MKVLIISNLRPVKSGITEQVFNIKNKLEKESFEVTLTSTYGSILKRLIGVLKSFKEAMRTDVVIGAGCAFYGFFPIAVTSVIAFLLRKPVAFNFHDGQAEAFLKKSHRLVRFFIRKKKIVVASEYLYNVFKSCSLNAVLINNFFDFDSFPEGNCEFNWNRKIVWARSFEEIYQPELAVQIALETVEKTDCEFHFYGNGSLLNDIKQKYNHNGIIYHGLVSREQLLKDLSGSSIFLNTTLFDNMPNSFFESGYYKLLIISTKVGGIATTFNESEILFTYENSVEAFTGLICDVFQSSEKYDSFRYNLNNKVLKYDWNNVRSKWLDLINSLYKEKKSK